MSAPIIEGFLYKNKKCKSSGWRKRWFCLRELEIPGRYVLQYAADKKKKVSGQIDLDQCQEVAALPPVTIKDNYRHVFDVKTTKQQYFLVASSELEMNNWISCLSRVCGITKENQDDDDVTLRGSPSRRTSFATIESTPSVRSSFSSAGPSPSLSRQDPPSRTGTLRNENSRSSPRPSPLVLTPLNLSTPAQRKTAAKGDNPYIFLSECVSRAVPSRPASEHEVDSRMWASLSGEGEPSVPDEPAPPPPQTADDLYKRPPKCEVYDSKKRWSDEKSDEGFTVAPSTTYDVVPRTTASFRSNDPLPWSQERFSQLSPSIRMSTVSSGETYDQVPPLSRNGVRLPNLTATIPRTFLRKQSLPNETENHLPSGSLYDQVPKPRTATNSPAVTRVVSRAPVATEVDAGLYDRPVQRTVDGRGSTLSVGELPTAKQRSPNLSLAALNSPREAVGFVAPPSVDRNAKPSHASGEDVLSIDRSPRSRIGSPHSSVGSATPTSILHNPSVSVFAYPRKNSLTAVPTHKVRRSTSQEDLAASGFSKSDFRLRGSTGTRTLPRQPKQQQMHHFGDVQYTVVQVCTPGSESKTLPHKVPVTPRKVESQVKIPPATLKSQLSQRSHNSSTTDYKFIDTVKTKALQKTKESVEKGEEADREKRKN